MPYPFAHPAAVLPLARPMGRFAAPSALAIGAVIPDAWYFVPGLARADTHSAAGLVLFCLPLGLAAYVLFHLLVKQPLVALLPRALACRLVTASGLPAFPWHAVGASLLAGAATHVVWDAAAHLWAFRGVHPLQHLSTALGTAALAWWCWRWLRRAPPRPLPAHMALAAAWRGALIALFLAVVFACAWLAADAAAWRQALRQAWIAGSSGFAAALLAWCLLWKLRRYLA